MSALCRKADLSGPCVFGTSCPEPRQRIQHAAGLRGMDCWAYQQISTRHPGLLVPPSEDAIERAAIEAEGRA